MSHTNPSRHDVVIIGGRVAGPATAFLLSRRGHDVVVVDLAAFPSDTLSTHAIARSGVVQSTAGACSMRCWTAARRRFSNRVPVDIEVDTS